MLGYCVGSSIRLKEASACCRAGQGRALAGQTHVTTATVCPAMLAFKCESVHSKHKVRRDRQGNDRPNACHLQKIVLPCHDISGTNSMDSCTCLHTSCTGPTCNVFVRQQRDILLAIGIDSATACGVHLV